MTSTEAPKRPRSAAKVKGKAKVNAKPGSKPRGRPSGPGTPSTPKHKRRYWAAETLNLEWGEVEVVQFIADFIELIEGGAADHFDRIIYLANRYKRKNSEIAVLIIDLAERGFISDKGRGRSKRKFNVDEL